MATEVRQRVKPNAAALPTDSIASTPLTITVNGKPAAAPHPSGREKHGRVIQILRGVSLIMFFFTIQITQCIGAPLYLINRRLFYDYMAVTKQSFGLVITTMTYWWGPTTIRISGDASVAGQIKSLSDGRVEFNFPERLVLIANHQIYTDWLYLWWVGYANKPRSHGSIYIILKESLKYIPIIGPGMMFYGFIFMSRKMAIDRPRMAHRLQKLRAEHLDPSGNVYYDPMWLLLFPEGTNSSNNGRVKSAKWAEKTGIKDTEHVLLPRSTGMYYCLSELKGSVDYVYDCTVAYEGVKRGEFGEQHFTLAGTYLQGQPPKSVNFYWRRFRVDNIPLDNAELFDTWLRERCAADSKDGPYIETAVRTRYTFEIAQMFAVPTTLLMLCNIGIIYWRRFSAGAA
ncbi:phospholipid/glycerol acyltransferase [Grosmannia clavigera kw1407]|uniref:Phospholipid/glycerol acyltransferase n=1 Tax=Grosmannia clavigera (strain kw1407 / UAMH 11150) TaxID=655863 RepID=F0XP31_GROCL|nr:phospholipid/glycerol acyltransferase [Grosmannia clavigera kw1407]EFX00735.1 phospholipid/glycerol acyltransferase [Grosmannia clavigera kw1407]